MIRFDKDLESIQLARDLVCNAKQAQAIYSTFSQQKVDSIVAHIAQEAAKHAEELAKMAYEETGFGNWQDKVLKNIFASTKVYEHIKEVKTVGVINSDPAKKVFDVGVPLGVITALVPSTNPTSTILYKTLIALKAGNAIIFSAHPNAGKCSQRAIEIVKKAALEAGAPAGIVDGLSLLTMAATKELMHSKDVALILATGGEGMVRAAYLSGTPTISGGPGNGPAFIERSANIKQAVSDIITSKTFDNGVICASEQSIIVEQCIATEVKQELLAQHAYIMNELESDKLAKLLLRPNGMINPVVVGKTALILADMAGFSVPFNTRVLISVQTSVDFTNPYSREKLCPVLGMYVEADWQQACARVMEILTNEGKGHTLVIHSQNEDVIREFALQKPVFRMLVNTPAALGGIGATTNLAPALTLGCGALGGGSTSDNVEPLNLINVRKVGYGVLSIDDLRQNEVQGANSVPQLVTPINNPAAQVSIFDDSRFTGNNINPHLNNQSNVDTRFTTSAVISTASSTEITEENVERIIKNVLGRIA